MKNEYHERLFRLKQAYAHQHEERLNQMNDRIQFIREEYHKKADAIMRAYDQRVRNAIAIYRYNIMARLQVCCCCDPLY